MRDAGPARFFNPLASGLGARLIAAGLLGFLLWMTVWWALA